MNYQNSFDVTITKLQIIIATISGTTDKLKRIKVKSTSVQKTKKPAINFAKCGIPVGAELVFVDDPNIKITVVDDRKVQ